MRQPLAFSIGQCSFQRTKAWLISLLAVAAAAAESPAWQTASPEEVGVDSAPLVEMFDFIREHETPVHSIQIVRKDRLVLDAYFYPYHDRMRHDVASVTKSITSTLIGLAIEKGHLRSVQEPALRFFPPRPAPPIDPRKSKLTLEHLLTMQAGWDCGFEPNEARLTEMRRTDDWIQFMLDLPMVADPGTRWAYCSGNCHVLSALLTKVTGTNALAFARRELFEPLGIRDVAWPADARGNNHGWGDLQLHPRDMAKIGQLFLRRGLSGDRQIISEEWIREATRAHAKQTENKDQYGYFWWIPGPNYPGVFEAIGRGGQRITVWPAKELVLVYTGGGFNNDDLTPFILRSVRSNPPLSPNSKALARLREQVEAAKHAPVARVTPELPAMAARISGRKYALSANSLDLSAFMLRFNGKEADLYLKRLDTELNCPVGLDGVARFSTDTLVELPFACKGEWLDDRTFSLELDRVAGVSCYQFRITVREDGKVGFRLKERTGLVEESFEAK
jgi:CubicO group peptidase (beta-lactamase class C family)